MVNNAGIGHDALSLPRRRPWRTHRVDGDQRIGSDGRERATPPPTCRNTAAGSIINMTSIGASRRGGVHDPAV